MPITSGFLGSSVNAGPQRQTYIPGDVSLGNIVTSVGGIFIDTLGPATASANNLTVPSNGDSCHITGATQINLINSTGWRGGTRITLIFDSTPTVKFNQVTSGDFKPVLLNGSVDFVATANSTLSLIFDGTNNKWLEVGRSKL